MEDEFETPLDEIDDSALMSERAASVENISDFAEQIRKVGLTNPILDPIEVKQKNESGKYPIATGLRRYHAYLYLNEKHPNQGWNKIRARYFSLIE